MPSLFRRFITLLITMVLVAPLSAQDPDVDKFFDEFTAEWVRNNPDQATSTRYFTGAE